MKQSLQAFLASVVLMGVAGNALAQDVAIAVTEPKRSTVVFTEKADRALSPTALATIRSAADRARDGRVVMLSGNPRDMIAVREALVRQGVSASAIVTVNDGRVPLPKPQDGSSDPAERRVEIAL